MNMNNRSGFTLVELLIAIAIGAILLTIAIPGYQAFIQNNKIASATNKLSASINLARMEAVKRGVKVSVCPSANSSFSACGDNTQWSQGWIVYVDSDNNNAIETESDLVKIAQPISNDATINSSSAIISYDGTGFLMAGTTSFSLTANGCTGNNARTINLAASGRVSVNEAACN